ncbi:hypothetical protein KI387_021290, partial [Taxus chinensis]
VFSVCLLLLRRVRFLGGGYLLPFFPLVCVAFGVGLAVRSSEVKLCYCKGYMVLTLWEMPSTHKEGVKLEETALRK